MQPHDGGGTPRKHASDAGEASMQFCPTSNRTVRLFDLLEGEKEKKRKERRGVDRNNIPDQFGVTYSDRGVSGEEAHIGEVGGRTRGRQTADNGRFLLRG